MPEPITAKSPRPLFLPDGRHWQDYGQAVYHLHRSSNVDLSTRMDVYSQLRDMAQDPVVTLHLMAGAAVFAVRLSPLWARGLADGVRHACGQPLGQEAAPVPHAYHCAEDGTLDHGTRVGVRAAGDGVPLVLVEVQAGAAVCPLRVPQAEALRLADMLDRAAATCERVAGALQQRRAAGAAEQGRGA